MSSRGKLVAAGGLALSLAVAGTLHFALNVLVQTGLERFVPVLTGVSFELSGVSLAPWSGRGRISGMSLGNPEGFQASYSMRARRIRVDLEPRSLLTDRIVIRLVEVVAPVVSYELGPGGSNLARILENVDKAQGPPAAVAGAGPSRRVVIDRLLIRGGRVRLAADAAPALGAAAEVALPDIDLRDIGKGHGGATSAQAFRTGLSALVEATTRAAAREGLVKEGARAAGKAARGLLDRLLKR